ncbi:BA14K family protein [Pararhizobium qamdonense]|uniref:BA14K family protein n=1 Tax=Pararhizobium qamdonense TaxID=3031126 RepID=UPI0023E3454B|nr:BA14K family protein [Pararhizobium qamdonense]
MTYPIVPVLGITLSLTAIAGSVMAIPNYLPEQEVKKLGNIDITSLWTSRPVSVDPSKQNFERLPALVVELPNSAEMNLGVDNIVASEIQPSMRVVRPGFTDDGEMAGVGLTSNYQADTEVAAWCAERYRSYRASDNTYQPYTGVRRDCEPLFGASVHSSVTNDVVEQASDIGDLRSTGDTHSQWCFARYRSYDPDNNTHRAFSGETRACVSPYI